MNADAQPKPIRRRRWPRIVVRFFIATFLFLVMVAAIAYTRYTDPNYLRPLVQKFLQQYANGDVVIEKATFSWWDGLRIFRVSIIEHGGGDVVVAPIDKPSRGTKEIQPLFSCRELAVRFYPWRLLIGRPEIETITAIQPTCTIVREGPDQHTNLAGFKLGQSRSDYEPPKDKPTLEFREARFRVVYREGDHEREVDSLNISIRGRPSSTDADAYELVWRGGTGDVTSGQATLNFREGSLRNTFGGLPWISLEAVMIAINAEYNAAGTWIDLLGLEGRVRVRDYNIFTQDGEMRSNASIDLAETALSIPIDESENDVAASERYLRFENVRGTINLLRNAIHMKFSGRFHDSECEVEADMQSTARRLATLDDVELSAKIKMADMAIPRPAPDGTASEARLFRRFPRLDRIYYEFKPNGNIDLSLEFDKKAGTDAPLNVPRAVITADGCSATYRFFPYEVRDLHGVVEYTPDGLTLNKLCGTHDAGTVCANGWMSQPNRCGAGVLEFEGANIVLDDSLYLALPDEFRGSYDQFCPEGTAKVDLLMTRSGCVNDVSQPWRFLTDIELEDVSATYVDFPYPISELSGEVSVYGNEVFVRDITGFGGNAPVRLTGHALVDDSVLQDIDLDLKASRVEIDETLYAALPESFRNKLRTVNPKGQFDADTRIILHAETGKLTHESTLELNGINLQHETLPLSFSGTTGTLLLTPKLFEVLDLRASFADAAIALRGSFEPDTGRVDRLRIETKNLAIDDSFFSAIPQAWSEKIGPWRADRTESFNIELRSREGYENGLSYNGDLRLTGATIQHPFSTIPFANVFGNVGFDNDSVSANVERARWNQAELSANVNLSSVSDEGVRVAVSGKNLALADLLSLANSKSENPGNTALPAGTADLQVEVTQRKRDDGSLSPFNIRGSATLHRTGLPQAQLQAKSDAVIRFDGTRDPITNGLQLYGDVSVASLQFRDLPIEDAAARWAFTRGSNDNFNLTITEIFGTVHGGNLSANLDLNKSAGRTYYESQLYLRGMNIQPLASKWTDKESPSQRIVDVNGELDASLTLGGIIGDDSTRRGEGAVNVRNGRLYRLPILWAIIQVINLNVGSDDMLAEAEVSFFVEGNRVTFDRIHLSGDSLELNGNGTLSIPDQGVNLRLINASPSLWDNVPLVGAAAKGVTRELFEFQVTGPVQRPSVRAIPLKGISDEIRGLFTKKKPKVIPPRR